MSSTLKSMMKQCRGLRGAITVDRNEKSLILNGSTQLLQTLIEKNDINVEDMVSIFFSVTDDLDQTFPAAAARTFGLTDTPLLCLNEIAVKGGLPYGIRILMHVNTEKGQVDMRHCYLEGAKALRPDLSGVDD